MVEIYYDTPLVIDAERVEALRQEIDEKLAPLNDYDRFRQDIAYLRSRGIRQKQLAILLKVSQRTFRYWKSEAVTPRSPRHFLLVRMLAKTLRQQETERRAAGIKPSITS